MNFKNLNFILLFVALGLVNLSGQGRNFFSRRSLSELNLKKKGKEGKRSQSVYSWESQDINFENLVEIVFVNNSDLSVNLTFNFNCEKTEIVLDENLNGIISLNNFSCKCDCPELIKIESEKSFDSGRTSPFNENDFKSLVVEFACNEKIEEQLKREKIRKININFNVNEKRLNFSKHGKKINNGHFELSLNGSVNKIYASGCLKSLFISYEKYKEFIPYKFFYDSDLKVLMLKVLRIDEYLCFSSKGSTPLLSLFEY